MKKTLLQLVLALAPISAVAYDAFIDGIYYNIIPKAKIAEVTSGSNVYKGDVIIPKEVVFEEETYSVASISNKAF